MTREELREELDIKDLKYDAESAVRKAMNRGYSAGYRQGYDDARKALSQEPCEDAVSREDVMGKLHEYFDPLEDGEDICPADIYGEIQALPSVTQKSGKWQKYDGLSKLSTDDVVICDQCAFVTYKDSYYKYCPNCGARMESEHEND